MVLVYAGRRAKSLPAGSEPVLVRRVQRLLAGLVPSSVIGAAADGGDLLVLETALEGRARPHVVLPTIRDVFEHASVDIAWRDRHRRALDRASTKGSVESLELPDGSDAYRSANQRMLERAAELAVNGERIACLVVAAPGEGTMVEDLSARARLQGAPVLRIDPSVDLATRPSCFVAMPYGPKLDPQRMIDLNCDLFYGRVLVPALEHAQLRYRRGDEQIDSGIVLQPMIQDLADADLVIADLATGNFNVGWELGLRHLLRPRQTLLALPTGTSAPFDLNAVRHLAYDHGERGLSDEAAIAGWKGLAPFLAGVTREGPTDNPVEASWP